MTHRRIAILWTIVIVFISQLFHCAYTNHRDPKQQQQHPPSGQTLAPFLQLPSHYAYPASQQAPVKPPSPSTSQQQLQFSHQSIPERETYEELLSSSSGLSNNIRSVQQQHQQQPQEYQLSARERCRELISLTLLSFRDLSPDERASEEIDCANLREQIAQAAGTNRASSNPQGQRGHKNQKANSGQAGSLAQPQQRPRAQPQPLLLPTTSADEVESTGDHVDATAASHATSPDDFPLSNNFQTNRNQGSLEDELPEQPPQQSSSARQQYHNFTSQLSHPGWQPKPTTVASSSTPQASSSVPANYLNQVQQLLMQRQHQATSQRGTQESLPLMQFFQHLQSQQSSAVSPTTTLFETDYESTMDSYSPPAPSTSTTSTTSTTTTTTTTTTTSTTTTPAPAAPRIKIGAGRRRQGSKALRSSSTTSTTTTTTTTPKSTDYADSSDVSTDYYDEYEDGTATTTTTTTTARPNRNKSSKRPKRPRTSPKPSTTTTTLSPGYQPRPDGRIIDYMADPNFPRELKGADLTNYPFYISVPEKIDFECKGRHDGYYTNIDLHCQIYHHCALGNRYDFLCPNYTLFDQTTFTCRFINTVDCEGSTKHFDRNNALYVEKDENKDHQLTSTSTSTTTSTQAPLLTPSSTSAETAVAKIAPLTTQTPKLNIQLNPRNGQLSSRHSTPAPVSALALIQQESPLLKRSGLVRVADRAVG